MNQSVKLTKVGAYRKSGTGNKVATFSVSGSKEAVEKFIADKTAELGACPMIDGTNTPRVSLLEGRYPGKNYTMQLGSKGQWSVIDNSTASQLKDLLSQERDPAIKAELAKLYATQVLASISNVSSTTVNAPVADEKL